jgi:HlyD family secretion protein
MNRRRFVKCAVYLMVLIAVAGFGIEWHVRSSAGNSPVYRTATVERGNLETSISATGTVEPEEVVDVGAQVAGKILSFGKDVSGKAIDYGSTVEQGTILAQIDDSLYAADQAQAQAQLDQAKAGVLRAEADLGQLQAKLVQAERDWKRARKLGPSDALSQSDFDAAESAYEVAKANVAVGKAAIVQANSTVAQAEANLQRTQQNLDYCTIKSPVKGVIIDRRVNIGQTVVSSLNAPSLFLIAKDLRRMQVWVAVNEADIGHIHTGQPVSFTVDAFPGETFKGEVNKVRLNASMTQNVVTYTVEVHTDNSTGKLLPYLTANVKFEVSEARNVLIVPDAALRYSPEPARIAPGSQSASSGKATPKASMPPGAGTPRRAESSPTRTLWVPEGEYVKPVAVTVGISDGSMTEVKGDQLKEGMAVVIGEEERGNSAPTGSTSPFIPQIRGRRGSSGSTR